MATNPVQSVLALLVAAQPHDEVDHRQSMNIADRPEAPVPMEEDPAMPRELRGQNNVSDPEERQWSVA